MLLRREASKSRLYYIRDKKHDLLSLSEISIVVVTLNWSMKFDGTVMVRRERRNNWRVNKESSIESH